VDRVTESQKSMVEQNNGCAFQAALSQRIAFLLRRRDAVLMINNVIDHMQRVLADRPKTISQQRNPRSGSRMRVHDAICIGPGLVNATVDREARFVKPRGISNDISIEIHLDKVRCANLVEHVPQPIDEKGIRFAGNPRGHVRLQQIRPAEIIDDAVQRGEITPCLPFCVAHFSGLLTC
jgi:hypothetical protein